VRIRYSKDQLSLFLRNVYDALFSGEHQVGRVVDALADARPVRRVRVAAGRPLCEKAALPRDVVVVDGDGVEVETAALEPEAALHTLERARRDARMVVAVRAGKLPYAPTVMSWLSRKLDKPSTKITSADVKTLLT